MARVELQAVEKVFPGGTRGLAPLDLDVSDGELVVLVGPSGCGKSTVLRLIAGLEEVTGGVLRIGERTVNALSPQARNVAMVFQDYALYPHMSVRGNIEFPLRMRKEDQAARDQRVAEVARLLDIEGLLERLPRQLSGGQRQRVAMGRALVRKPSVSLLDEPLSNLDARLRIQVRAEIKQLQVQTGTTMLYVTHDQVEAMTLGDRIVVLNAGVLQQVASPRDVYARPENRFVAGFIGNPPMNLFPIAVQSFGDREVEVVVGALRLPLSLTPARRDTLLRTAQSGALVGGLRSEALREIESSEDRSRHETPAPRMWRFDTTIKHLECLGHETLAHVVVPELAVPLVARLAGLPELAVGGALRLTADPDHLFVFDANGRRVIPE